MMNSQKLTGIGLALGVAFGTTACTTTGTILPKIENSNTTDEASCLFVRVRGFNPGILPLIGFRNSDTTRTDSVCVTRQTVQQLIVQDDVFFRTVGYETYKLLPPTAQEQVQQFLILNGTKIEDVAASVPQVDETITDCARGQVRISGRMPDGQQIVRVKPIIDQPPANQNAGLNTQSPPPVQTFQCPAQP